MPRKCHHCSRHNETHTATPSALQGGQGLMCCGREAMAAQGQARMVAAAADFVQRLAVANPDVELIGEYNGTNTPMEFRCKLHNEVHSATPKLRLQGLGLYCCHQANGRAMGRLTGPLNGWKGDSVWEVLAQRSNRCHDPAALYLFSSSDTPLLKFGITTADEGSLKKRASRSHFPSVKAIRYGDPVIEPRRYPDRDTAVLIEGGYQWSYGAPDDSSLGIGHTELTADTPEVFLERIEELENALLKMGLMLFAEEYCYPLQVEKAKAVLA